MATLDADTMAAMQGHDNADDEDEDHNSSAAEDDEKHSKQLVSRLSSSSLMVSPLCVLQSATESLVDRHMSDHDNVKEGDLSGAARWRAASNKLMLSMRFARHAQEAAKEDEQEELEEEDHQERREWTMATKLQILRQTLGPIGIACMQCLKPSLARSLFKIVEISSFVDGGSRYVTPADSALACFSSIWRLDGLGGFFLPFKTQFMLHATQKVCNRISDSVLRFFCPNMRATKRNIATLAIGSVLAPIISWPILVAQVRLAACPKGTGYDSWAEALKSMACEGLHAGFFPGLWFLPYEMLKAGVFASTGQGRHSFLAPMVRAVLPADHPKKWPSSIGMFAGMKLFWKEFGYFPRRQILGNMRAMPLCSAVQIVLLVPLITIEKIVQKPTFQSLATRFAIKKDLENSATSAAHNFHASLDMRSFRHLKTNRELGRKKQPKCIRTINNKDLGLKQQALLGRVQMNFKVRMLITVVRADLAQGAVHKSLQILGGANPTCGPPLASLIIRFKGEPGQDAGGVFREYLTMLASALEISADLSSESLQGPRLLARASDNTLWPAPEAEQDKSWAALVGLGRLLAIALLRKATFPLHFQRTIYKLLLKDRIEAGEVRALDPIFFDNRIAAVFKPNGLQEMEQALGESLTFMAPALGDGHPGVELKPGGKDERVTEETKDEYVRLMAEAYLLGKNRCAVAMFCKGFHDVLPVRVLRGNPTETELRPSAQDLELISAGTPVIDVDDWQRHCRGSAIKTHPQLFAWFWEVLHAMDHEARARVLGFATGSVRIPSIGFQGLSPPFNIEVVPDASPDLLPIAHTCANSLHLAPYPDKQTLATKLSIAINSGAGFGFA